MTDKEKIIKLFRELEVGFDENHSDYGPNNLVLFEGHPRVSAYAGMYCAFEFDKTGTLQGIYLGE